MNETIDLGGRHFAVRPLKLGELRHVLDALQAMEGKSGGALIEAAAEVVAAGLRPQHPQFDAAAVLDLEATVEELNAAVAAILRVAGLRPAENSMGEALPVATQGRASGSAQSTAPSPPAAAFPGATSTR